MRVYDKVKALAKEKGITISQLEKDLSLSAKNTCKWNRVLPRADTLKRLADYFGVSVGYFLEEESRTNGSEYVKER